MKSHIAKITVNRDNTNTYFGQLAHEVLYTNKKAIYFKLQDSETIFVFEDKGQKDLVCCAGLSCEGSLNEYLHIKLQKVSFDKLLIIEIKE